MIYFLINNDYHLDLDLKLIQQLDSNEIGLIQVPQRLDVITNSVNFSHIVTINEIDTSLKGLIFKFYNNKKILKYIDCTLTIKKEDVLLVHTDMVFVNQYIITKFFDVNAKIFIVEDGTATIAYNPIKNLKISWKDIIRESILKYLYSFRFFYIKNFGSEVLPIMDDFIFKGVILRFGNSIKRNIPLFNINTIQEINIIKEENGAIFFNQPLYNFFLTEEDYLFFLQKILSCSNLFSHFYFKFHPADTNSFVEKCSIMLNDFFPEINIVLENMTAEKIIYKYPVKYTITINSTASLNLIDFGLEPIFLNNIFKNKFPDLSFDLFDNLLDSMEFNYPLNIDDIKPGFSVLKKNLVDTNYLTLKDIINKND